MGARGTIGEEARMRRDIKGGRREREWQRARREKQMEMGRKQRWITTESSGGRRKSLPDLRVQSGFVVQSGAAVTPLSHSGWRRATAASSDQLHTWRAKSGAELKWTDIGAETELCWIVAQVARMKSSVVSLVWAPAYLMTVWYQIAPYWPAGHSEALRPVINNNFIY